MSRLDQLFNAGDALANAGIWLGAASALLGTACAGFLMGVIAWASHESPVACIALSGICAMFGWATLERCRHHHRRCSKWLYRDDDQ